MDKLLLLSSLSFIVLLSFVNSAPTSKIISSLQSNDDDENVLEMPSPRQHKMMGFYNNPYIYVVPFYPPEFYDDVSFELYMKKKSQNILLQFDAYYGSGFSMGGSWGDEDEIMSRTAGNRKRPGSFKNSPIYYIRYLQNMIKSFFVIFC